MTNTTLGLSVPGKWLAVAWVIQHRLAYRDLRQVKSPKLNITGGEERGKNVPSARRSMACGGGCIRDHYLSSAEKREARRKT